MLFGAYIFGGRAGLQLKLYKKAFAILKQDSTMSNR